MLIIGDRSIAEVDCSNHISAVNFGIVLAHKHLDYLRMDLPSDRYERAVTLQNSLVGFATGESMEESIYLELRREFMEDPVTRGLLPGFVRTNRSNGALWGYFKRYSGSWQPRREHIWEEFGPLLDHLEGSNRAPADSAVTESLRLLEGDGVNRAWAKALDRRLEDPDGAITAAKALLETICKQILEEVGVGFRANDDLPKLYHETAKSLNLAPSQHTEKVFRSILGNCQQVVNNLGTLRNKMGDAHGQGKRPVKPSARHAALAVNLAGSVAAFLVETWRDRLNKGRQ